MANEQSSKKDRREYFRHYMREYRQRNPERVKKTQEAYWLRRLQRQQLAGENDHSGVQ